jgi:sarcosine oxidase
MIVAVREGRRCLVIGAGLLGLCAAWALAQRGWSVEVLDAGDAIGHARAGSKGDARIFRLGYPEPFYVAMASRAGELWRQLEARSGRTLLHPTGQLSLGDEDSLAAVARALDAHGAPYVAYAAADAQASFPGVVLHGPVLFEPSSGVLAAEECLSALCDVGGFPVHTGVTVTALDQDDASVHVRTASGGTLTADIVIDCAGPDALRLLGTADAVGGAIGDGLEAPPSLPQVAYFRVADAQHDLPPVFIEWGDGMVYGLPVPAPVAGGRGDGHLGLYKVSHHTPGPPLPRYVPTDTAPFDDDPSLLATLTDAVARLLPSLDPEPVATERCIYDNTADTDFVLDRVGRIVVGCGTSGHGFKFGPLLGEVLAHLAEDTTPAVDLTPFRLTRPEPGG